MCGIHPTSLHIREKWHSVGSAGRGPLLDEFRRRVSEGRGSGVVPLHVGLLVYSVPLLAQNNKKCNPSLLFCQYKNKKHPFGMCIQVRGFWCSPQPLRRAAEGSQVAHFIGHHLLRLSYMAVAYWLGEPSREFIFSSFFGPATFGHDS